MSDYQLKYVFLNLLGGTFSTALRRGKIMKTMTVQIIIYMFNPNYGAGIDFSRQNLTSDSDV